MDVIVDSQPPPGLSNPGPMLLTILLDGRVVNCQKDADCPGLAFCARADTPFVSWRPALAHNATGMCYCEPSLALGGADCDERSATTNLLLAGYCFCIAGLATTLMYSYYLLFTQKLVLRRNLTSLTFAATVGGAIATLLVVSFMAIRFADFGMASTLSRDGDREENFYPAINICIIFAFGLIMCAMLQISVVWTEYGLLNKPSESARIQLGRYKVVIGTYVAIFGISTAILLIDNHSFWAAVLAVPALLFVVISFGIGAVLLRGLLIRSDPEAFRKGGQCSKIFLLTWRNIPVDNQGWTKSQWILRSIRNAAIRLSFLTAATIVSIVFYVLFFNDDTPVSNPASVAALFIWLFMAFIPVYIIRYIECTSPSRIKRLTPMPMNPRELSSYHSRAPRRVRKEVDAVVAPPNSQVVTNGLDPALLRTWRGRFLLCRFRLYEAICTGEP